MLRPLSIFLATSCLLNTALHATEAEHHGPHVHGVAELTLVLEGDQLEMEFRSPSMSIVGFEYHAKTESQEHAVLEAQAMLSDGGALFSFSGAECALKAVNVDVDAVLEESDESDDRHEADEHHELQAQHKHAEQEDPDENEHHDDEHHEGTAHSDITAHYTYQCANAGNLRSIGLKGKTLPFRLNTINAMWVVGQKQGLQVLDNENLLIPLK